ncbi:MAG: S41 family peptidase [Bacteroidia bacterium]|nr:S41 family peptidase [Bacteroidia bacterium]
MKKLLPLLLIVLTLLGSCKKDEPDPITTDGVPAMARDTLYYIMKQWYYWFNLMPAVERINYPNPYELLEAMRYKEMDKWSFVADYDEFIAEMGGTFVGHGFRIGLDKSLNARIAMIYNNSPLYLEGVRRGWIVKKINGYDIAQILLANDGEAYQNAIGPSTAGVTNAFIFQKPDGTEVTISSTKQSFTINTVILYDTLHLSSGITGHLVFESFIEPSEGELETAFAFFQANNVKDLIVDLRYNSGGYLYIAQQLASYIAGNSITGTTFAKLSYNAKSQSANNTFAFQKTSYPLSLPRLAVITTRLTASASEAVMNGLKPHLNLISIGDTTLGKPMGMNGWICKKKYFFWPVTFKIVNSANEGEYYDGMVPTKVATDDIAHDFDDRNEECLKEAISWLQTGSFTGKGAEKFSRYAQFSEKPSWMNNAFVIRK